MVFHKRDYCTRLLYLGCPKIVLDHVCIYMFVRTTMLKVHVVLEIHELEMH